MAIPAKDIPSLSQLYNKKRLCPLRRDDDGEIREPEQSLNDKVGIIRADITKLEVDAIVNAANKAMLGGGGVDGAIHRAAGPGLLEECRTLGGCETGSAKITDAYKLPCKKIIHTVGPIYSNSKKAQCARQLESCYRKCLDLAVKNDCKDIVFNCVSTGVYGYPNEDAAVIAISTVRYFLKGADGANLEKVVFCIFTKPDVEAYNELIPKYFPPTKEDLENAQSDNEDE